MPLNDEGTGSGVRTTGSNAAERLEIGELGRLLRERRGTLSIRQAAADAEVSFSTFSRVEAGAQPDLATFTRLCAWLGQSPSRFFTPVVERDVTPVERALTHLWADPRLPPDAAAKIGTVLKEMYAALARDLAPAPATVACHLRAAPMMRPGVAPRLASLLQDMHAALERQVTAGEL